MKDKFLPYLGTLIFLFSIFYVFHFFDLGYKAQHPTLNRESIEPDLFLKNTRHYVYEEMYDRSGRNLENALRSLQSINEDVDLQTSEQLCGVMEGLEKLLSDIQQREINYQTLNDEIEKTLNTLCLAELRVSEKYAETNHINYAKEALKFAMIHIQNAMEYSDAKELERELAIYYGIDSLLENRQLSPIELTTKLSDMIGKMEMIVKN